VRGQHDCASRHTPLTRQRHKTRGTAAGERMLRDDIFAKNGCNKPCSCGKKSSINERTYSVNFQIVFQSVLGTWREHVPGWCVKMFIKGGPEPLEKDIHKILDSKREDRFSDPFLKLVQKFSGSFFRTCFITVIYVRTRGHCKSSRRSARR